MPFKYVKVPSDTNYPLEEHEFANVDTLEKGDPFLESLKAYFSSSDAKVDESFLLETIKTHHSAEGSDQIAQLPEAEKARIFGSISLGIFTVLAPLKENGHHGISMYCDDKGISKRLPPNSRATGIVRLAGYAGEIFHGDVFIGGVIDDEEGNRWFRTSFGLQDCSSDAPWIKTSKMMRDKADLAKAKELSQTTNQTTKGDAVNHFSLVHEAQGYTWQEAQEEVTISIPMQAGQTKNDVKVQSLADYVKIQLGDQPILANKLFLRILPDETTWTISDGILHVTLMKAEETLWRQLLPTA